MFKKEDLDSPLDDDVSGRRISKSCDTCKVRKVKCDGIRPLCSYCVKNKMECVYSPMKRPGLKRGYGKEFNERLESVENACTRVEDDIGSVKSDVVALFERMVRLEASNRPGGGTTGQQTVQPNRHGGNSGSFSQFDQSGQGVPLQLGQQTAETMPINQQTPLTQSSPLESMPEFPNLPPITRLVAIYFEKVHPAFPILHKDSILHKIQEDKDCVIKYAIILVTLKYVDSQLQKSDSTAYFALCKEKIVLRCISMVTLEQLQAMTLLAYQSFGSLNNPETWSFISLISSAVTHLGLTKETNNSQHMQFLENKVRRPSIATSSEQASPNSPPNTVTPGSQSTSSRKRKSLSTNPAKFLRKPDNWVEEESRRRLFWGIYILDVFSAISNSFSLKIPGDEITCMLPVKHSLWYWQTSSKGSPSLTPEGENFYDTEELYDSFAYYVELLHVLGEIHLFLRKQVDIFDSTEVYSFQKNFLNLYNRLLKWKSTIPPRYQALMDRATTWDGMTQMDFNLASLYHTAMIRLNSAIGYPHAQSDYLSSSKIARDRCLLEVDTLTKTIRTIETIFYTTDDAFGSLGPCFAFTLWVAGRLVMVDSINKEIPSPPDEDVLVSSMLKIGTHWGCAARYAMIIKFLMGETMNVRRKTIYSTKKRVHGDPSESEEESDEHAKNSKIFSDMRNNAFVLDFIFSQKIPNLKNAEERSGITTSPPNQFSFQNNNGVLSNIQYYSGNFAANSPTAALGSLQQFQKQQKTATKTAQPAQSFSGLPQSQLIQPVESLENIFQWFKFPVNLNVDPGILSNETQPNGNDEGIQIGSPKKSRTKRRKTSQDYPVMFAGMGSSQQPQPPQQPPNDSRTNGLRNFNMFDVEFELSPSQVSWDPTRDWLDNSVKQ
ncbi:unnamed protein product [Kuraishia capsulata CBS 1993]|uniref:Zn(2)-C6 fungal-type domain-containing protein n=1 Tax=Kuraishia capsulata CBS 1993 TaxID=1382522 RepID=W6MTS6_9ASCO|nr:uncharacterized protein KUCA_T00004626001 [Kuraishia capsulata CBS 1993]CDK28642.1 unnamed protein product [Kuraishia capsulata CBS 1993]